MNAHLPTLSLLIAVAMAASCSSDAPISSAETASPPMITISNPPVLQSSPPLIYLAENLDEPDQLGWCIDTAGRGESDQLHTHSCKPGPVSDVNFTYDPDSGLIRSAPYDTQCAEYSDPDNATIPFGLLDCDADNPAQQFDYDPATWEMRYRSDPSLCMTAGENSQSAGPYVSRTLTMQPCSEAGGDFKQWIIASE